MNIKIRKSNHLFNVYYNAYLGEVYNKKKFTKPQESENEQNLYNQNKMQNFICLNNL